MILYQNTQFETQKDLFEFLKKNKNELVAQKRAIIKQSDSFQYVKKKETQKSFFINNEIETIQATIVMNTTNIMDSHDDVHIDGLWKKTITENKNIFHLREHIMAFDSIIASGKDISVYTQRMSWEELGYDTKGETEALIFVSNISKKRNDYMFQQYSNGYVLNHSVGMQYVKIALAINSEEYPEENEVWEKYINKIANKEKAIEKGYFWAVTEAKLLEGSAVVIGSNPITPTLSIEPSTSGTQKEPLKSNTQKTVELIKNYKFFK